MNNKERLDCHNVSCKVFLDVKRQEKKPGYNIGWNLWGYEPKVEEFVQIMSQVLDEV